MPSKSVPVTTRLREELSRTLQALERYEKDPGPGTVTASKTHAALHRATMDLSRLLTQWRQTSAMDRDKGMPK